MIDCENFFCIYWRDRQCILDSISIDCLGICEDYTMVDIDEDYLRKKRTEKLKELS